MTTCELDIIYSGCYHEVLPSQGKKNKVVLDKKGDLYIWSGCWTKIKTGLKFLFYNEKKRKTYIIANTPCKSITRYRPTDTLYNCIDKKLYKYVCGHLQKICSLCECCTIVKCTTVLSDDNPSNIKFKLVYPCIEVSYKSEIPKTALVLDGTINACINLTGLNSKCSVLVYTFRNKLTPLKECKVYHLFIQGEQGPPGPEGPQGEQGPPGQEGSQGPPGPVIIPYASGYTTINENEENNTTITSASGDDGTPLLGSIIGFGVSRGVAIDGSSEPFVLINSSLNTELAFTMPRNGTIKNLSVTISGVSPIELTGGNIIVSIFKSNKIGNTTALFEQTPLNVNQGVTEQNLQTTYRLSNAVDVPVIMGDQIALVTYVIANGVKIAMLYRISASIQIE